VNELKGYDYGDLKPGMSTMFSKAVT